VLKPTTALGLSSMMTALRLLSIALGLRQYTLREKFSS